MEAYGQNLKRCEKHKNKIIFSTLESAKLFLLIDKKFEKDRIYKCPGETHFHIASQSNKCKRRKAQAKRAKQRKKNEAS